MTAQAITITFGDVAENGVSMQKIGNMHEHGFSREDMERMRHELSELGCETELIEFGRDKTACVLIAREAVQKIVGDTQPLFTELAEHDWDRQEYSRRHTKQGNVICKRGTSCVLRMSIKSRTMLTRRGG